MGRATGVPDTIHLLCLLSTADPDFIQAYPAAESTCSTPFAPERVHLLQPGVHACRISGLDRIEHRVRGWIIYHGQRLSAFRAHRLQHGRGASHGLDHSGSGQREHSHTWSHRHLDDPSPLTVTTARHPNSARLVMLSLPGLKKCS